MTQVVVTNEAIRCAKLHSNRHHQQTNQPSIFKNPRNKTFQTGNCMGMVMLSPAGMKTGVMGLP